MLLHWLDALLNLSPSKYPLDEYRPDIAHPETAQDWIANIKWLKEWLTSVFTNILKLDPDFAKRTTAAPHPVKSLQEDFRFCYTRQSLEEVRRIAFATLDDLAKVLQEQEYGSLALLSPHVDMVWPIIRAHLDHPEGLQLRHAQLMLARMRGLQSEARNDMNQVLSVDERGRRLLQAFQWKPFDWPDWTHAYLSFRGDTLRK